MLEQKQIIESDLVAQGWTMKPAGNSHGLTITACKDSKCFVVYSSTYIGAWQAVAERIKQQA